MIKCFHLKLVFWLSLWLILGLFQYIREFLLPMLGICTGEVELFYSGSDSSVLRLEVSNH